MNIWNSVGKLLLAHWVLFGSLGFVIVLCFVGMYACIRQSRNWKHLGSNPCPRCKRSAAYRRAVRSFALGTRKRTSGMLYTCDPCPETADGVYNYWGGEFGGKPYVITYSFWRWWLRPWHRSITRPPPDDCPFPECTPMMDYPPTE